MGWIIGVIIGVLIILTIYSCCIVSGRSSRLDDKLELKDKTDILLYNRDEVTIADCLEVNENHNLKAVLCAGRVLGFTEE